MMIQASVVCHPMNGMKVAQSVSVRRMTTSHLSAYRGSISSLSSTRHIAMRKLMARRQCSCQAQIGLVMSTMTGHTAEYAEIVKKKLGQVVSDPVDIADIDVSSLATYDGFIVGAPTWHTGADVGRSGTSWDDVLSEISSLDLGGKYCAVFGLGDSIGYSENFCDAIEEIHDTFMKAGCKMVGYVPSDNYTFDSSKSVRDGKFLGLALDYDNEDDKAEQQIESWAKQLRAEMEV